MSQRDYEHGRNLILSRLKSAERLLAQTRPGQDALRAKLASRIGWERVELAKRDMQNKPQPPGAPIDPPHYEEPCRILDIAA